MFLYRFISLTDISATPRLSVWLGFISFYYCILLLSVHLMYFLVSPVFLCPQVSLSFIWQLNYSDFLNPVWDISSFLFYQSLSVYVIYILLIFFSSLSTIDFVITVNIISCFVGSEIYVFFLAFT